MKADFLQSPLYFIVARARAREKYKKRGGQVCVECVPAPMFIQINLLKHLTCHVDTQRWNGYVNV